MLGRWCRALSLGITDEPAEISRMARRGSFSAAASVIGGMVFVESGRSVADPYGEQVFSPAELDDVSIVIVPSNANKEGHDFYMKAATSPLLGAASIASTTLARDMIRCFADRDIEKLAYLSENHLVLNYGVLQSGDNNMLLWTPSSLAILLEVRKLRNKGIPVFSSMNTGASVFIYCFNEHAVVAVGEALRAMCVNYSVSKVGSAISCAIARDH